MVDLDLLVGETLLSQHFELAERVLEHVQVATLAAALRGTKPSRNRLDSLGVTRRLSDGHVDGVEATWHRADAVEANLKLRN